MSDEQGGTPPTQSQSERPAAEPSQPSPAKGGPATAAAAVAGDLEIVGDDEKSEPAVTEPGKPLRIAVMLREMQEEVRRASPDQAGRDRLKSVHDKAIDELAGVLSKDLREELAELTLPFENGTPTESEILIAQAQLLGWLEGLFQGIQAAMFSQQMQARQQFEQMRQRGLPPGIGQPQANPDGPPTSTGQYL